MKSRRRVNSTVTLNAFFSLLLVILAAQFPCGSGRHLHLKKHLAIVNGIGGEPIRQDS
jgi:hypothetical protein